MPMPPSLGESPEWMFLVLMGRLGGGEGGIDVHFVHSSPLGWPTAFALGPTAFAFRGLTPFRTRSGSHPAIGELKGSF